MSIFIIFLYLISSFTLSSPTFAKSCSSPPPGDANNDCLVDGQDYIIWLNHYNQQTTKGAVDGDFDGNSSVDGLDYIIWRNSYDKTSSVTPTITSAIPLSSCLRPWSANSPWNRPIGSDRKIHPNSEKLISSLTAPILIDPVEFTYPIYPVNRYVKFKKVKYSGEFRSVDDNEKQIIVKKGQASLNLPIPDDATAGQNASIILLNLDTGEEWNLLGAKKENDDSWSVKDIFKYHTRYSGFAPGPFSRKFGTPLLAGLIRACEIRQGEVNHAIAFSSSLNIPRGYRLQLKPNATDNQIRNWCANDKTCRIITKALQQYGMYQVDSSYKPAIFVENNATAHWGTLLTKTTLKNLPTSAFQLVIPQR